LNKFQCKGCKKECRSYGSIPEVNCNLPERKFYPAKLKDGKKDCYPTIAPRFDIEGIKWDKNRLLKCNQCEQVKDFSFFGIFKGRRRTVCRDCISSGINSIDIDQSSVV